jgi:endonuclease/exonuclease/phosphatase family metal-dependent hydrolase
MLKTERFRIATFNIQHAATGDYGRGYPDLLAQACVDINADILGLQEVDVNIPRSGKVDLASYAAEACGMNFVYTKARTFRGRGQCGNALLVRGDINDVAVLKLLGDRQKVKIFGHEFKPIAEPRNATIADVRVRGQEFSVANAHLGGGTRREQLSAVAAALACRTSPQILMGDLNLWLADVRAELSPYDLAALQGPDTNPAWAPRQQIDHIAMSGLRALHVEARRMAISDHLALIANVTLPHRY